MKIREFALHNYRAIKDATFYAADYGLLIGANNSGKTTVLDALRNFYEKDIKFDYSRDFPKFETGDKESWIEVEYELTKDEAGSIKAEYLQKENRFRVRKVLQSDDKARLHLFAYEGGGLSANQFYGDDNVGLGKLGDIIHIPAISKLEDVSKFSGASPLRELVNNIFKKLVKGSVAFTSFQGAISKFGQEIQVEQTADKRSLKGLEDDINSGLGDWDAKFKFKVNPLSESEVVKSMLDYDIFDETLKANQSASSYGHGFQRQLIYRLFRVSAAYSTSRPSSKKKDFSPDFTLLLFEEPEAFLHPSQQSQLDRDLRKIGSDDGRQVLVSTHSPQFVSHATENITGIARLHRSNGQTAIGQVRPEKLDALFSENQEINKLAAGLKNYEAGAEESSLDMEAVKYFLWLNPERCGLFFAKRTLVVEGPSELVLINYLIQAGKIRIPAGGMFVLDVMGKFNIHRFMNLLGELKIEHAVLHDTDPNKKGDDQVMHEGVNKLIQDKRNPYTQRIHLFADDLETFLGFKVPDKDHRKPSRLLLALKAGKINQVQVEALCKLVEELAGVPPP